MKKLVLTSFATAWAVSLYAQAPFTIVRPQEGQTVREVVDVLLPLNSVPRGMFIGVTLNDKYLEATVPIEDKKRGFMVYKLDTKALSIPDGEYTLGLLLYGRQGTTPVIVEKTEVRIKVANKEGIKVPDDGFKLRYKFRPKMITNYSVEMGELMSTLSDTRNRLGGRATEIPVEQERFRFTIAVDDVKPDGNGLVRVQILPDEGKDYAVFRAPGDPGPRKHFQNVFSPLYRLMKPTGEEVYADVPGWMPTYEFGVNRDRYTHIILLLPLPMLPTDHISPGDSWQTAILLPSGDPTHIQKTGAGSDRIQARGEFVSVEWEKGFPCAKLRYEFIIADPVRDGQDLKLLGREFRDNSRIRMEQTVWFALNEGRIVRWDAVFEGDTRVPVSTQGGAAGGGGGAGGPRAAGAASSGGGDGRAGDVRIDLANQGPQTGGTRGGGGGQGGPTAAGASTGAGQPGGAGAGAAGGRTRYVYVRTKHYFNAVIEK